MDPADDVPRGGRWETALPPTVLLVGDWERPEFDAAVTWLRVHTRLTAAHTLGTRSELDDQASSDWDHVVVAQSRPGQFTQAEVDHLGRRLPLAQFTALLGSACEGESRSGRPWPGVVRVYWHQWLGRAPHRFRARGAGARDRLPRTASESERLDHALRPVPPRTAARLAIDSLSATSYAGLAAACRLAGYRVEWAVPPNAQGAADLAAALWHRPWIDAGGWSALQSWSQQVAPVPVVALWGFPRHDQVRRARGYGVAAVLSVPFLLPDLWTILREVTA